MPLNLSAAAAALVANDPEPAYATTPQRATGRAVLRRMRVERAAIVGVEGIDSQDVGELAVEEYQYGLAAVGSNLPNSPDWGKALAGALAAHQSQVVTLLHRMQSQLSAHVANSNVQMTNINARLSNGLKRAADGDALSPLLTPAGTVPRGFPSLLADVAGLSADALEALLTEYGQSVPCSAEDRRRAFAIFVGVRLE